MQKAQKILPMNLAKLNDAMQDLTYQISDVKHIHCEQ